MREYGLWDQIKVNHGKEWCLMLYVNDVLSHLRGNCSRSPHTKVFQVYNKIGECCMNSFAKCE